MLKLTLTNSSPQRGHKGVGKWAGFLRKFDNGRKTCTLKEIQAFLKEELTLHNSLKESENITVSDETVRKLIPKVCPVHARTIDNGRVILHFLNHDIREFGDNVYQGNKFLLDPSKK